MRAAIMAAVMGISGFAGSAQAAIVTYDFDVTVNHMHYAGGHASHCAWQGQHFPYCNGTTFDNNLLTGPATTTGQIVLDTETINMDGPLLIDLGVPKPAGTGSQWLTFHTFVYNAAAQSLAMTQWNVHGDVNAPLSIHPGGGGYSFQNDLDAYWVDAHLSFSNVTVGTLTSTPLPAGLVLMLTGLAGLGAFRRAQRARL